MDHDFEFVTPSFKIKTVPLDPDATIAEARHALAPLLRCSADDLHIFFGGRKLDDTVKVAATYHETRRPVVYRFIPNGLVASDPDDFDLRVENLMYVVIDEFGRDTVGEVLRSADYDLDEAVERLLVMAGDRTPGPSVHLLPPSPNEVPAAIWRQLEQVMPAGLEMATAVYLYKEVCNKDLEMAIGMLRALPRS
jgi:hypothetical protein